MWQRTSRKGWRVYRSTTSKLPNRRSILRLVQHLRASRWTRRRGLRRHPRPLRLPYTKRDDNTFAENGGSPIGEPLFCLRYTGPMHHVEAPLAPRRKLFLTHASELAHHLVSAIARDAMAMEFVRGYAARNERQKVLAGAERLREMESTISREALLLIAAEVRRLLPRAFGLSPKSH